MWINAYNALAIKTVTDNPCKKPLLGLKKTKIASIKGKCSARLLWTSYGGGMLLCV